MLKNTQSIFTYRKTFLYLCIILSAFFVRCGFPGISIPWLTVLGYAIFIECIRVSRRPFITGIVFGAVFNMSLCSWIYKTLVTEFHLTFFMAFLFYFFVIGIILSGMHGFFALITHRIVLKDLHGKGRFYNYFCIVSIASLFVVFEWLRVSLSPEYGWAQLATIFYKIPEIFVIARWAGGAGLSFLGMLLAGLFWNVIYNFSYKNYKQGFLSCVFAVLIVITTWISGSCWLSIQISDRKEKIIEVAIIHTGIEQSRRWKKQYFQENLNIYQRISNSAFLNKSEKIPRLIVWPETSLATYEVQNNGELAQIIRAFCEKHGAWLLAGFPAYKNTHEGKTFFNSAFLISEKGEIKGRYDKKNLLPFAERKFSFVKFANNQNKRSYSPGKDHEVLLFNDKYFNDGVLRAGISICYESGIISHISKAAIKKMQILINISNDAWFGDSSESEQQLSMMALRCLEYGVPGIRGTGYGVAAIIDRYGRIDKKTDIKGESVLSGKIRIPSKPETFYRSYKDWFVILCMFFIFILTLNRIGEAGKG